MEAGTTYFEKRGKGNTTAALRLARRRAEELGIGHLVLATTHGYTALEAAEIFRGSGIQIVAVGISTAFDKEGWIMSAEERRRIEEAGVRVLTSIHGLGDGVAEGLYGEHTAGSVVSDTLRLFSQGMKVAVEVTVMALEAGMIPGGGEIIAAGGTVEGCDTVVVIRPAHARRIKKLRVCEIICKPRIG